MNIKKTTSYIHQSYVKIPFYWTKPALIEARLIYENTFRILNTTYKIDSGKKWHNSKIPKLLLYNIHYFDDLISFNYKSREKWHYALLDDWIINNTDMSLPGWDPYPVSRRIVNILKWYLVGNKLKDLHVKSLASQANHLFNNLEYHILGNHLFANAKALIFSGICISTKDSQIWYEKGLKIVNEQIKEQVLDDGANFELSPMYHSLFLEDILDIVNIHFAFKINAPANLLSKIPDMLFWLEQMCHPDKNLSYFNDVANKIAPSPIELIKYANRLGINRKTNFEKKFIDLEQSGYSKVNFKDYSAIIDRSPIGPDYLPGHGHADTFSFELSLGDKRFIVNNGTYTYERNEKRHELRSTKSHSTVVIDDENSSEVWGSFRVARRARIINRNNKISKENIILEASHDGYKRLTGKPIHARKWEFKKNEIFIYDYFSGKGKHNLKIIFNFFPGLIIKKISLKKYLLFYEEKKMKIIFHGQGNSVLLNSFYYPEFGVYKKSKKLIFEDEVFLPHTKITQISID